MGMDNGKSEAYLKSLGKTPEITDPYAYMEKQGMTVTRPTPEQIAKFYEATRNVRDNWTTKIGPDLVKAAQEDMAKAR